MSPRNLTFAAALGTIALGAAAGPVGADTTAAADPSAANVTAYGAIAAWSRKAADGYHLVIRQAGTVADAPVLASPTPYDPDLGPTKANGRTIVYARGGDLYRYDVGAAAEQKLTAVSSGAIETAPSFFKDRIVFSRTNGRRPGTYLSRPGRPLARVFKTVALETDVAETRIIGRYGIGVTSIIRLMNLTATDVTIVARSTGGQVVTSPTLTRFNGFWLRVERNRNLASVERVGVNAHRGLDVLDALRGLNGQVGSLATDGRIPTLYTTATGVQRIDPKLDFDD